jgi:hypothetical protein
MFRYLLLSAFGLIMLVASLTLESRKTSALPGCSSGATCNFYIEMDWCESSSSGCLSGCAMYYYTCCHRQRGQCIDSELWGNLAYCDDFCMAGRGARETDNENTRRAK